MLEEYRKGGADSPWRESYDEGLAEAMNPAREPAPSKPVYRD
ncbi:hypothetical protein [Streptomyces oceani]|nr:hypothetical protein [Streptomyces oceani]